MNLKTATMKRQMPLLLLSLVSTTALSQSNGPIKIAGSFDRSGPNATTGTHALKGTEFAVELLNKQGGVMGRQFLLAQADNGTNPQRAVNKVKTGSYTSDWAMESAESARVWGVWAQAATAARSTEADVEIRALETRPFTSNRDTLQFAKYEALLDIDEVVPGSTSPPSDAVVLKSQDGR